MAFEPLRLNLPTEDQIVHSGWASGGNSFGSPYTTVGPIRSQVGTDQKLNAEGVYFARFFNVHNLVVLE